MLADVPQMTWFADIKMPLWLFVDKMDGECCGFNKVRGEWSLMALCYNFTRVLNILGFERFVAFMAAKALAIRECALVAVLHYIQLALGAFWTHIVSPLAVSRLGPTPAG
jgi:hypothetical protein